MATKSNKPPMVLQDSKFELRFSGNRILELDITADSRVTIRLGSGFVGVNVFMESPEGSSIPKGIWTKIRRRLGSHYITTQVPDIRRWAGQHGCPSLLLDFYGDPASASAGAGGSKGLEVILLPDARHRP